MGEGLPSLDDELEKEKRRRELLEASARAEVAGVPVQDQTEATPVAAEATSTPGSEAAPTPADATPKPAYSYEHNGVTYSADSLDKIREQCPFLGKMSVKMAGVMLERAAKGQTKTAAEKPANKPVQEKPKEDAAAAEVKAQTEMSVAAEAAPFKKAEKVAQAPDMRVVEANSVEAVETTTPVSAENLATKVDAAAEAVEAAAPVEAGGPAESVERVEMVEATKIIEALETVEQTQSSEVQPAAEVVAEVSDVISVQSLIREAQDRWQQPAEAIEQPVTVTSTEVAEASLAHESPVHSPDEPVTQQEAVTVRQEEMTAEAKDIYEQLATLLNEPAEAALETEATVTTTEAASDLTTESAPEAAVESATTTSDVAEATAAIVEIAEKTVEDRPLEVVVKGLAERLETTKTHETDQVAVAIRDLAEVTPETELTPAITQKLVTLMRSLGYEQPDKALLEYIRVEGYEELIKTIAELATVIYINYENAPEFLLKGSAGKLASTDTGGADNGVGKLLFKLLKVQSMHMQPAYALAASE